MKAGTSGTITIGPTAYSRRAADEKSLMTSLTIRDQNNGKEELYLSANNDGHEHLYELPPLPPADVFDARFSSHRFLEVYDPYNRESRFTILIQSCCYPLTVTSRLADGQREMFVDVIADGTVLRSQKLESESNVTIDNGNVHELQIRLTTKSQIPESFKLEQNYPNPFNPVSTVIYNLPEPARVNVSLRDILGRDVVNIVSAIQEFGSHRVMIDAVRLKLGSGLYFYTCKATGLVTGMNYQDTKKLIYLK